MDKKLSNVEKWRYLHGENGITFALFGMIGKKQLSRLLANASWSDAGVIHSYRIKPEQIQFVHLFPNFGKRWGYGEPDVIIITDKLVIYVELELSDLSKHQWSSTYKEQIKKFILLGEDLKNSKMRLLVKKFIGPTSGFSFEGKQALRRIFKQIQHKKRDSCILTISQGKSLDLNRLYEVINIPRTVSMGWISYKKIMDMKNVSNVVRTIRHVLTDRE